MKIQRTRPEDAKIERYIITSMVVSDDVCRALKKTYDRKFFQSKLTREVAQWCIDFYKKYESAPKQDIQAIFETKTKAGKIDPDLSDEIEYFLSDLSREYEEWEDFNVQYYVETAQKYFKKRSYVIFSEQIKEAAENDDVAEAEKVYANYTRVQEQQDTSRRVYDLSGIEALRQSLESKPPFLFQLPGPLGQMIGPIERSTFIGLLGREKVGKTYNLQLIAEAGAKQGLKVAFIEIGDMTQDQLDIRIHSSRTRKVAREEKEGKYIVPVLDCLWNQMGRCDRYDSEPIVHENMEKKKHEFMVNVKDKDVLRGHVPCFECYKDRAKRKKFRGSMWWEEREFKQWTWGDAKRAAKKFSKHFRGEIITDAYPMRSMKISDMRDWVLTKYKQSGWLPDLLLIDYPDIALPEDEKEFRHQENEKWMLGRQMSQEFHCCVVFPTQADAKSYGRDTLKLDNYSEDKRKYAHTTHFISLNKTEQEEEMGCCRWSTLMLREDSLKISQQVTVLQELTTSRPYVASFFGRAPTITK